MFEPCSSDWVSCDLSPSGPSGDSLESIGGESGNCGGELEDKTGCRVGDGPGAGAYDRSGDGTFLCRRRISGPSWGNGAEMGDISGSALTGEDAGCTVGLPEPALGEIPGSTLTGEGEDTGCRDGDGDGPGPEKEVGTCAVGSNLSNNGTFLWECFPTRINEGKNDDKVGYFLGSGTVSGSRVKDEEDDGPGEGECILPRVETMNNMKMKSNL